MSDRVIALDVGGSKIAAALVGSGGEISHARHVPTSRADLASLVDQVVGLVDDLAVRAAGTASAVGIAVPGIVDPVTGTALVAANLPWRDTPLAALVSRRCGLPTTVGNDGDGAVLAEKWFGAAQQRQHFACITIGTGIGGGIVIAGALLRGSRNSGCEIGHMVIDPAGPRCRCGSPGCLEVLAAGPAIAARVRAAGGQADDAKDVIDAAHAGDRIALDVLRRTAGYLAVAVLNVWRLFEPEVLVLGGGVAAAGPLLRRPLLDHLEVLTPRRRIPAEAIVCSTIHRSASYLAAAALVLEAAAAAPARPQGPAAASVPPAPRHTSPGD